MTDVILLIGGVFLVAMISFLIEEVCKNRRWHKRHQEQWDESIKLFNEILDEPRSRVCHVGEK